MSAAKRRPDLLLRAALIVAGMCAGAVAIAGCGGDADPAGEPGSTGTATDSAADATVRAQVELGELSPDEPYVTVHAGDALHLPLAVRAVDDSVVGVAAVGDVDAEEVVDDLVLVKVSADGALPDVGYADQGVGTLSTITDAAGLPAGAARVAIAPDGRILAALTPSEEDDDASGTTLVFVASDGSLDVATAGEGLVAIPPQWAVVALAAGQGGGWLVLVERRDGNHAQGTGDGDTHLDMGLERIPGARAVAVVGLTASGDLDPVWGRDGAASLSVPAGRSWMAASHDDGGLSLIGWGGDDEETLEIRRLGGDGSPLRSWGSDGALALGLGSGRLAARDVAATQDGGLRVLVNHTTGDRTRPYVAAIDRRGRPLANFGRAGLAPAAEAAPATEGQTLQLEDPYGTRMVVRYVARVGEGFGLAARRVRLDSRGRPIAAAGSRRARPAGDAVTGEEWRFTPRRVLGADADSEIVLAADERGGTQVLLIAHRLLGPARA